MSKTETKTISKELQILNAQEAVNKIMSIQKYMIWMVEFNDPYYRENMSILQKAYSDFLSSEGEVLITSGVSMQALSFAMEKAQKWEEIADFVRAAERKAEERTEEKYVYSS